MQLQTLKEQLILSQHRLDSVNASYVDMNRTKAYLVSERLRLGNELRSVSKRGTVVERHLGLFLSRVLVTADKHAYARASVFLLTVCCVLTWLYVQYKRVILAVPQIIVMIHSKQEPSSMTPQTPMAVITSSTETQTAPGPAGEDLAIATEDGEVDTAPADIAADSDAADAADTSPADTSSTNVVAASAPASLGSLPPTAHGSPTSLIASSGWASLQRDSPLVQQQLEDDSIYASSPVSTQGVQQDPISSANTPSRADSEEEEVDFDDLDLGMSSAVSLLSAFRSTKAKSKAITEGPHMAGGLHILSNELLNGLHVSSGVTSRPDSPLLISPRSARRLELLSQAYGT